MLQSQGTRHRALYFPFFKARNKSSITPHSVLLLGKVAQVPSTGVSRAAHFAPPGEKFPPFSRCDSGKPLPAVARRGTQQAFSRTKKVRCFGSNTKYPNYLTFMFLDGRAVIHFGIRARYLEAAPARTLQKCLCCAYSTIEQPLMCPQQFLPLLSRNTSSELATLLLCTQAQSAVQIANITRNEG